MNTASNAIQLLEDAVAKAHAARTMIDDLIVAHDYQDAATLVVQASVALLEAAALLLTSNDEAALEGLERADDLLDAVYTIIDGETDEDE
ncbi:MAG: hypothetical protein SGI73_09310 [Chloroflexota bacterium]|nr:hypothetical protein [Chloroflexota bacterium]